MRVVTLKRAAAVSTFLYRVDSGWRVLGIMPKQAAQSIAYKNSLQIKRLDYTEHVSNKVKIFLEAE